MLVTEDGMVTDIRPEHPQKAPCARTGGGEQPASKLERVSPPSSRRRTRLAVRGHVGLLRAPPPVAQARDHVAAITKPLVFYGDTVASGRLDRGVMGDWAVERSFGNDCRVPTQRVVEWHG